VLSKRLAKRPPNPTGSAKKNCGPGAADRLRLLERDRADCFLVGAEVIIGAAGTGRQALAAPSFSTPLPSDEGAPAMTSADSVSYWIGQLKAGSAAAAQGLWEEVSP
jgi:hypothetical protein